MQSMSMEAISMCVLAAVPSRCVGSGSSASLCPGPRGSGLLALLDGFACAVPYDAGVVANGVQFHHRVDDALDALLGVDDAGEVAKVLLGLADRPGVGGSSDAVVAGDDDLRVQCRDLVEVVGPVLPGLSV